MNALSALLYVWLLLPMAESRRVAANLRLVRPPPHSSPIGWGGSKTCSYPAQSNGSTMEVKWRGGNPDRRINLRLYTLRVPSYKPKGRGQLLMTVPGNTNKVSWIINVTQQVDDPPIFQLAVDQIGTGLSYSVPFYIVGPDGPTVTMTVDRGKVSMSPREAHELGISGSSGDCCSSRSLPSASSTTSPSSARSTLKAMYRWFSPPRWSLTNEENFSRFGFPATRTKSAFPDQAYGVPTTEEPVLPTTVTEAEETIIETINVSRPTTSPRAEDFTGLTQPQIATPSRVLSSYHLPIDTPLPTAAATTLVTTPSPVQPTRPRETPEPPPEATSRPVLEPEPETQPTTPILHLTPDHHTSIAHPTRKPELGLSAQSSAPTQYPSGNPAPPPSSTMTHALEHHAASTPASVPPSPRAPLDQGDKAGLGIGLTAAALLVAGAVWFLLKSHGKKSRYGLMTEHLGRRAAEKADDRETGGPGSQPLPGRSLSGVHKRISGISWLMLSPRTGPSGGGEKDRRRRTPSPLELLADSVDVGKAMWWFWGGSWVVFCNPLAILLSAGDPYLWIGVRTLH